MQPQAPNPYDFITAAPDPNMKRRSAGSSKKQRILIVAGLFAILVVIGLGVISYMQSNAQKPVKGLIKVAQQQTEIIRVADMGIQRGRSKESQDLAITAKLSLTTANQEIAARLSQLNVQPTAAVLGATMNTKIDAELKIAEETNRFDEAFVKTLNSLMLQYHADLRSAYSATTVASDKQLLQKHASQISLILGSSTASEQQ